MKFPEEYRILKDNWGRNSAPGDPWGAFYLPARYSQGRQLRMIASDGDLSDIPAVAHLGGWEHVSVSVVGRPDQCPSWKEMCQVKGLFWEPEECVIQFHPPESQYVNNHPGCLHLWKLTSGAFPLPDSILVGKKA